MIVVHHLNNSRSQRVLWMLEELGLEYEVRRYQRDPQTLLAPPSLKAVHPLGKSPVIQDGELTLAESGAILEYLAERPGGPTLRPEAGTPAELEYRFWLHYAEGSLMPLLLLQLAFRRVRESPMPFFARPIARKIADKTTAAFIGPQLESHLDFIEQHLSRHTWFVGDALSAADIQMSFPLEAAAFRGLDEERYPHIAAFVGRLQGRPAYQRALEAGGPYDYA